MDRPAGPWLRRLDVVSIALFLAALAYFGYRVVATTTPHGRSEARAVYSQGETLTGVPELHLGKSNLTAIVVISPACRFCQESLPLYQELNALARDSRGSFRLVFVAAGDEAATKQLLHGGGISEHELLARPKGLRVGPVPMVLLSDPAGKVRGIWLGLLEGASRSELLDRARAAAKS
jgi:hypothetical protein